MTVQEEKESLFDEDFNCKTTDIDKIMHFCTRLKKITGIHTCNHLGMMYEYLPQVYRGAIQTQEK